MYKVYFERHTGKPIKILIQEQTTTVEQDLQNNPELVAYPREQIDFVIYPNEDSTNVLDWFRINRYTRKLEPTHHILQAINEPGPQGEPGRQGEPGPIGPPGERGLPGAPGKDAQLPFKMWVGTAQTNASGVASITIPTGTFNAISHVLPSTEANVSKAEEVPHASLKTYSLTSVQVNVTKYKMLSGLLGLTPTGDFVGAGVKVNVLVIGS